MEKYENDNRIAFGKVLGTIEALQDQITELKTIIKEGFLKVVEECNKNINIHADVCPLHDVLNKHMIMHEEYDKYKKQQEIKDINLKTNKINWFRWIVGTLLSILGIKGLFDVVFRGTHKVVEHADKIIK